MKILAVAGARPNFMKIAPLIEAIGRRSGLQHYLVLSSILFAIGMFGALSR